MDPASPHPGVSGGTLTSPMRRWSSDALFCDGCARQRGRDRHPGRRSSASETPARAWARAGRSRSYTRPVSRAVASWSSAAGHAAPWGTVATGTSCTTVTSRSTSTTRSTTWMAACPDAAARVSSQARWRHDDEHHFGIRPRAGSRIGDPHQPHARVCPGSRGDRDRRSSVAAMASLVVFVSPVFMHVPPRVCFVPTTLAGRECKRCVSHRFRHFLGGALVVRLFGFVTVGSGCAVSRTCDGSERRRRLDGSAVDQIGVRRAAQDLQSKCRQEFAQRDATGCQA